jgi:hypothetical protein
MAWATSFCSACVGVADILITYQGESSVYRSGSSNPDFDSLAGIRGDTASCAAVVSEHPRTSGCHFSGLEAKQSSSLRLLVSRCLPIKEQAMDHMTKSPMFLLLALPPRTMESSLKFRTSRREDAREGGVLRHLVSKRSSLGSRPA